MILKICCALMGVLKALNNVGCDNRVLNRLFSLRFQVLGEKRVRLDNGGYTKQFLNRGSR
jgi:hypothetical protein